MHFMEGCHGCGNLIFCWGTKASPMELQVVVRKLLDFLPISFCSSATKIYKN